MQLDFPRVFPYLPYIVQGTLVSLEYTLLAAIISFIWGTVLSIFKISGIAPLRWFGIAYTSVFRGVPLLVQLVLIYYATPQLTGYNITALQAGVLAFGLNSAAYVSETIRGGILAVDKGQREAALSLGLSYRQMMFDIILPQAVKNILPALVNESIALLKDTSLVSTIGALDLLRRAEVITGELYLYFEPLIIVAAVYYILVMVLTWLGQRLERRMRRSD